MASASLSRASVLLRPRNFRWYWNSATDPWSDKPEQWQKYTDVENEIIEDAYKEQRPQVRIDGGYVLDFKQQIQYEKDDQHRQRPIKRVQLEGDRNSAHIREERFSSPVILASTSTTESRMISDQLTIWQKNNLASGYYEYELENKNKTVADIVEEAAEGMMKEGTAVDKTHEAQWLAEQLLTVKQTGAEIQVIEYETDIPSVIGETCVYLYTKESFWYKLLNRVTRDLGSITRKQAKTLGPFCYLLFCFVYNNCTIDIPTVYRSLNLDEEQRQNFMKKKGLDSHHLHQQVEIDMLLSFTVEIHCLSSI